MELIFQKFAERQAELATLPIWVIAWVIFMRVWMFSGLLFILRWKPARWVLLTMIATGASIMSAKIFLPDLDTLRVGTIVQLVLWLPLAWYLVTNIRTIVKTPLKSVKLYQI